MSKNIHINNGPNVTNSVACMIAIFFIGSILLFSTFLSQGVFADSMSERMKIREELSGVSSDDQNIMSASASEHDSPNGNCARGACHIGPPGAARTSGTSGTAGVQGIEDRRDQQVQRDQLDHGEKLDLKARKAILVHKGLLGLTPGPWIYLTFDSCSGTNGNHDVTCNVHDETGITHLTCTVANPAISGGDNVGNCTTNNNKHLLCTIAPQPGVFGCNLQS